MSWLLLKLAPVKAILLWVLVAAVLAVIGGLYVENQHLQAVIAEKDKVIAQERENAAHRRELAALALADEQAKNRIEDQRRVAAQKEATDEAQRFAARARADAAAVTREHGELRSAAVAAASASCRTAGDPVAVGISPPAESAGTVLADVLSEMDEAAGELAEALDLSRVAGQLCERSYDALMP